MCNSFTDSVSVTIYTVTITILYSREGKWKIVKVSLERGILEVNPIQKIPRIKKTKTLYTDNKNCLPLSQSIFM